MKKGFLYSAIIAGLFSVPAQAYEGPQDMEEWIVQAGELISAEMRYPARGKENGHIGVNSYEVLINRYGDVLRFTNTANAKRYGFNRASKRALEYVDFPALPENYGADQLRFSLNMYYFKTEEDLVELRKQGAVTGRQITLLPLETSSAVAE